MSETLSNVLSRDFVFTPVKKLCKTQGSQRIPIIPTAGSVASIQFASNALYGLDINGAVIWTVIPSMINGTTTKFSASLARINDNSAWVMSSSDTNAGAQNWIGILNFATGGITSIVSVAPNPNTQSLFGFNVANFYNLGSSANAMQLKLNGNLCITSAHNTRYYEFTTSGASVLDVATMSGTGMGICNADDESCSICQFGISSTHYSTIGGVCYDINRLRRYSYSILFSKGVAINGFNNIWSFGKYAITPHVSDEFQTIFLKSDIDKIMKRIVSEAGGSLS